MRMKTDTCTGTKNIRTIMGKIIHTTIPMIDSNIHFQRVDARVFFTRSVNKSGFFTP
jgi:hypothetical protein